MQRRPRLAAAESAEASHLTVANRFEPLRHVTTSRQRATYLKGHAMPRKLGQPVCHRGEERSECSLD